MGPSAEMVMIDRMFIQEEKIALSQDRILAKERPGTQPQSVFINQFFGFLDLNDVYANDIFSCISRGIYGKRSDVGECNFITTESTLF